MIRLLLLALFFALPQTTTHTFKMQWTYDCVHYPAPKYFQFGTYSNGYYTPIGKTTVQSCRGSNWQFTVNGTTTVPINARTKYYVRGINSVGTFGPAAFTFSH
jgi:hypothetical protein